MTMKKNILFIVLGACLMLCVGYVTTQSNGIRVRNGDDEGKLILNNSSSNQTQPFMVCQNGDTVVFQVSSLGVVSAGGSSGMTTNILAYTGATTNQLRFVGGILTAVVPQ